ncbi:hypothetical protein SAMN04488544_1353 [Microlunatus sagamiharensis]|uniref:Tat (Twin-arginine translocation) pathway signal sequence n=1 Tax=Microlunatus sagamiharensis TaxID=546874 RepID=A0A1H2M4F2_9ACTN|nr:hypothetical protein [Microlunatus sagamiharensis]SDU87895.1 hypothetical protein SAMN04488544_1353 [Microlunatus sagamiharensis]
MTDRTGPPTTTRRALLGTGAALGAALPLLAGNALPAAADQTSAGLARGTSPGSRSASAAFAFLRGVTDASATWGPRLAQSYDDSRLSDIGFVYDNALTCIALLAAGDWTRARAIGDALLQVQDRDPAKDGRLRQAYHVGALLNADQTPNAGWEYGFTGTAVGDMAWAGLALAQLARRTKRPTYLAGSRRIARWVVERTRSSTGLGGFTFGETAGLEDHKSTEHNIDLYALFRLVATLTGDRSWDGHAEHARAFVRALWNAEDGHFWTGSDDGASINKTPTQLPLDAQTWASLSLGEPRHRACLDWARTSVATTDTPLRPNSSLRGAYAVSGVGFGSGTFRTDVTRPVDGKEWNPKPDDAAVWFEGTAQLALALQQRGSSDDRDRSRALMDQLRSAQDRLGAGQTYHGRRIAGGIVAASSPMDTGFGFDYSQNLHTGATAWYLFAAMRFNPFRF